MSIVLNEDDPWEHDPPPATYDDPPPCPADAERAARAWAADRLTRGEP